MGRSTQQSWLKGERPKDKIPQGKSASVFGKIEGVDVGDIFENRIALFTACVHGHLRAGISGSSKFGAYSVVMSGGYEDDVDKGETFFFTGSGGRDTKPTKIEQMRGKTNKWEGTQTRDQEFKLGNEALRVSSITGTPVRVTRGAGLDSIYAPVEGYRYDGLYKVTRAWQDENSKGLKVCRYSFERLPNQGTLPLNTNSRAPLPLKKQQPVASSSKVTLDKDSPTSTRRAPDISDPPKGKRKRSPSPERPSKVARAAETSAKDPQRAPPREKPKGTKPEPDDRELRTAFHKAARISARDSLAGGNRRPPVASSSQQHPTAKQTTSTSKQTTSTAKPTTSQNSKKPRYERDPSLLSRPFGAL